MCPAAEAGIGFQPVSSDELKMTAEPLAPGAPAIILYRQADRDDNRGVAHEDQYFRIKVLTEEGRKYAEVEIPFEKFGGEASGLRARTIRPDGTVSVFDGKVEKKWLVKGRGLRYQAEIFTLPDVQVGSIIEYSYTKNTRENWIVNSNWILSSDLFTKRAVFSLKPFKGYMSRWSIRWTTNDLPDGAIGPKEDASQVIRLDVKNVPAFHSEDYMPPEQELKARVDFIYGVDTMTLQGAEYWKEAGKKMSAQLESFIDRKKAMEQAVAGIVAVGDSPEVKMEKIYSRVQQIRNTSYEVRTEQEQVRDAEKPSINVEEVWKKGYGNGRELTWLYLALVRAVGLEAYGVSCSPRNDYFFSPQSYDSMRLTANVVLMKVGGKDVYAAPGAAFAPFGLLPWGETSVDGLKMDKDGGTWVRTPLPSPDVSQIQRTAKLKLNEAGDLEGKLTVTYTGLDALDRRVKERSQDTAERKKYLEDEVKGWVLTASEVELTSAPEWKSSSPTMVAEFNLKVPGWGTGSGKRMVLPLGLFTKPDRDVFEKAERVHPIYFEYPTTRVDDLKIELPEGWDVSNKARDVSLDNQHAAVYKLSSASGKNSIEVKRSLVLNMLLLDRRYYPTLRGFFSTVKSGDMEQVVVVQGS
jgi:hypothetical protein